jgi:probable rRNA maturation factor
MEQKKFSADLSPSSINQINFNLVDVSFIIKNKTVLRDWLKRSTKKEKKTIGELSFNVCSDTYLLNMNKEYLNHDYYTDIITFDFSLDNTVSGDIYISIDRVKENAKSERKTISNELSRVMVHGLLHLCGYKDKTAIEAAVMRQKEDYCLSLLRL